VETLNNTQCYTHSRICFYSN